MPMSWGYAESTRDDEASIEVIHQALDAGVGLFDTARVYGDGHNERLLGRALRGRTHEVTIATKGGLVVEDLARRAMRRDARPEALRRQIDESLANLGVEAIDLYYLHRVDPEVPLEESWGALAEQVGAGKIRGLGLSEVTVAQAVHAHAVHPVTAIQSELSLWTRDALGVEAPNGASNDSAGGGTPAGGDLVGWTAEHQAAFIPFAPLGRGYLTATLTPDAFEASDFRADNPRFTADAFRRNAAILDEVRLIASDRHVIPAQVALAWLLGLGDHVIPIPGTRSPRHLHENLAAAEIRLDDIDRARLNGLPAPFGTRY
jgi:aryl-alcohol dehydrogenase-like predicted oxidoreductase